MAAIPLLVTSFMAMALLLASGRGGFPASAAFGIAGLQAAYDARCRTGATDNRRTTNAVEARR
jgi:hypothetical protein